MTDTTVQFKDFSKPRQDIKFKIDDDVFTAYSRLSPQAMQNAIHALAKLQSAKDDLDVENLNVENLENLEHLADYNLLEKLSVLADVLDGMLQPESAKIFRERLLGSDNVIDYQTAIGVMQWLMEVYGLRPTQQSEPSSAGSPSVEPGTTSADGASVADSDPSTSTSTSS